MVRKSTGSPKMTGYYSQEKQNPNKFGAAFLYRFSLDSEKMIGMSRGYLTCGPGAPYVYLVGELLDQV